VAVRKIVLLGDPILRQRTEPITRITKKINKLIDDMLDTMYAADGVGLAAPQIGENKQIVVIDVGEGPIVLINPEIINSFGEEIDVEGCLSIPGKQAYVKRAAEVDVRGLDRHGKPINIHGKGLLARALQHEIDHLNGILYIDYIDEKDLMPEGEE